MFFKLTLERFAFHVAATGAATEDRELVPAELAATVGEDRRWLVKLAAAKLLPFAG